MRLFDLHCDTIGECYIKNQSLGHNEMHISLEKASYLESWCQLFAIWIPDELRGQPAQDYFDQVYARYQAELSQNAELIAHCETGQDIKAALKAGKSAAILTVEGGAAAAGSLEGLHDLYNRGVRVMTLTWNGSNEIANGCFSDDKSGLTAFGKECVAEMERLGMVIDVSHLNKKSFFDVADNTKKPFIASHSNYDMVDNKFGRARNLTEEQLKLIIDRQGLVGINLCDVFLGNEGDNGFEAVYRHIAQFLEKGGENVLAMGCDFDGCTVHPTLNGIDKLEKLYLHLLSKKLSQKIVDKIFFNNAYNFFTTLLHQEEPMLK